MTDLQIHPARGFNALGINPARGVGAEEGNDGADVVGQAYPALGDGGDQVSVQGIAPMTHRQG